MTNSVTASCITPWLRSYLLENIGLTLLKSIKWTLNNPQLTRLRKYEFIEPSPVEKCIIYGIIDYNTVTKVKIGNLYLRF